MIIKRSKSYAWVGIVIAIVSFVFVSVTILPKAGACFTLPVIFGFLFLFGACVWSLRDNKARIKTDDQGIVIRGEPKILWHTIKHVRSEHWPRGLIFILLEFVNGKEQRFDVTGLDVGYGEIVAYIRKRLAEVEEARSTRQSTPLVFGKYRSDHPSTMEDFAIAEWHPTDKDMDGGQE